MARIKIKRRRGEQLPLLVAILLLLFALLYRAGWFSEPEEDAIELAQDAALALAPMQTREAERVRVAHKQSGKIEEMALEDYLVGVVAAEMPAKYEPEALKAQAVAARTYTVQKLRANGGAGCASHEGADVCTGSGCCQAYREGGAGESVLRAVRETAGEVVLFDGQPIRALYHASSGGHTEDVEQVYAQALPYLRGVVSEGDEQRASVTLNAARIQKALPQAQLSLGKALSRQIEILHHTPSGYVGEIRVGEMRLSGHQLRRALGLRSANFSLEFPETGQVTFCTRGHGHGVGMSQVGANAMAAQGATYVDILTWYYTGTSVRTLLL